MNMDMSYVGFLGPLALLLDLTMVGLSIWMAMVAKRSIGGLIGSAINWLAFGIILLGFAHIIATLMDMFVPSFVAVYGDVFHRVLVLLGFILLGYGFKQIDNVSKQMRGGMPATPASQ
jgi:uncharacterized membrane protein